MTKVKICGITNLEDALLSAKFGADMLGFNFYEKSPRYIEPDKARTIINQLPGGILTIGVFVNENIEKLVEIARTTRLDGIQLHGDESPEFADEVKKSTQLSIIKAFRVSENFDINSILNYSADAILLDAFSTTDFGGTGKVFDWEIANRILTLERNIYMAGGLCNENIVIGLSRVQPYAVDACSSLELTKGRKDRVKLINFITRVREFDWSKNLAEIDGNEIRNMFDYLKLIHLRPAMYIGEFSISKLYSYLGGFHQAIKLSAHDFDMCGIFSDFHQHVQLHYNDNRGAMGWGRMILEYVDGDEKLAIDTFFALIEEYKFSRKNND